MTSKTAFIQPILTSYRDPVFEELNKFLNGNLIVCAESGNSEFGSISTTTYEFISLKWTRLNSLHFMPLYFLFSLLRRCNRFIHCADFKFFSLWAIMMACLVSNKKLWLHGQGGYKRTGIIHKILYTMIVALSDGYICYTHFSAQSLKKIIPKYLHKKIFIVNNTLCLNPVENITPKTSNTLLYIGRLRTGCNIELLLQSAKLSGMNVKIIGQGEPDYIQSLKNTYTNAQFFGPIFNFDQQAEIASDCLAGVYAGDAGLSIVHYMAFGLPVIAHNNLTLHMGPEPSYIQHGVNGLTFQRNQCQSLANQIIKLKENPDLRNQLANGALNTFLALKSPSMAKQFSLILEQ